MNQPVLLNQRTQPASQNILKNRKPRGDINQYTWVALWHFRISPPLTFSISKRRRASFVACTLTGSLLPTPYRTHTNKNLMPCHPENHAHFIYTQLEQIFLQPVVCSFYQVPCRYIYHCVVAELFPKGYPLHVRLLCVR